MLAFQHHIDTAQRTINSAWFIVFLTNISAIVAFLGMPVWMIFSAIVMACGYTIILLEHAHVNTKLADEAITDPSHREKLRTVAQRADDTISFVAIVGLITSIVWIIIGFLMLVDFPLFVNHVEMERPYFLSPAATIIASGIFYFYIQERAKLAKNVTKE
jgi:hypothetical protein